MMMTAWLRIALAVLALAVSSVNGWAYRCLRAECRVRAGAVRVVSSLGAGIPSDLMTSAQEEEILDPKMLRVFTSTVQSYPPRKKKGPAEPNTWRKNLPRKLKRKLKNINESGLLEHIFIPRIDDYLKNEAKGAIYDRTLKLIHFAALRNNVTVPEGFGVRPRSVRPTALQALVNSGNHTLLIDALQHAGLTDKLNASDPITIFAPHDNAIRAFDQSVWQELQSDPQRLSEWLLNHMLTGYVSINKLTSLNDKTIDALGGLPLRVKVSNKITSVQGVPVSKNMLECYRGIVHPIDKMMDVKKST